MRFPKLTQHLFKRNNYFQKFLEDFNGLSMTIAKAIENEKPIHILLVDPPGLDKTRFLKAIEKEYPDLSYFALASGSTGAGMINHCFQNPPFLLIDEIEDMPATIINLLDDLGPEYCDGL